MSRNEGKVQTVLGTIEPSQLGIVHMHEHLLIDLSRGRPRPVTDAEKRQWERQISLETLDDIRHDFIGIRSVVVLDEVEQSIEEAREFAELGGGTLVDVSSGGIDMDVRDLQRISREVGVHIVRGAGYYVNEYHPPEVESWSSDEIGEAITRDVVEGKAGVPAGIIGEIGLTWPLHPGEEKVLRAAALAQRATGAAITLHPGRHPGSPMQAVRILDEAGADLSRVIVGHIDRTLFDLKDMVEVARAGCTLEFDLFGSESTYYTLAPVDMPNDGMRVNHLMALVGAGLLSQLVISHDICTKLGWRKYGGRGYGHILRWVVPLMRRKGMSQDEIDAILIQNPARLLALAN